MKKLTILLITLILLAGCPGGDDGPGPPEDIGGLWAGGGTATATQAGYTESTFIVTEVFFEPLGNRQYVAAITVSIPDHGIYQEDQTIINYDQDGNIRIADGTGMASVSRIRGNHWHTESSMVFGDIVLYVKQDLYRQ